MEPWLNFLRKLDNAEEEVTIGLVGKYVELQDAYKSINESLFQAATYNDHKLKLVYIHSEKLNAGNVTTPGPWCASSGSCRSTRTCSSADRTRSSTPSLGHCW